jgi:hypothetical protein
MGLITHADEFGAERLKAIEARLDLLERRSLLDASSIKNGTLTLLDANGKSIVVLGLQGDGTHGISVTNANGRTLFKVTSEGGQSAPFVSLPGIGSQALASNTANGFRPGTTNATMTSLFAFDFWSVGPTISYDFVVFANAGNISWQISCRDFNGGTDQVVVGPNVETTNVERSGTFTIPAAALAPGTGTDPAGRRIRMDFLAQRNSGTSTADIALVSPPRNYT